MKLDIPLCRTNKGQKSMSFLGPNIWNMLSSNIKAATTTVNNVIDFCWQLAFFP